MMAMRAGQNDPRLGKSNTWLREKWAIPGKNVTKIPYFALTFSLLNHLKLLYDNGHSANYEPTLSGRKRLALIPARLAATSASICACANACSCCILGEQAARVHVTNDRKSDSIPKMPKGVLHVPCRHGLSSSQKLCESNKSPWVALRKSKLATRKALYQEGPEKRVCAPVSCFARR